MRERCQKGISSDALKVIAMLTMLIDHIGAAVLERGLLEQGNRILYADLVMRGIGRISFPIFCFLLTEGFVYTHSRKKYIGNMGLFAILSEIPFDLAFCGKFTWEKQNVYLTLFIGLFTLYVIDEIGHMGTSLWETAILMIFAVISGACVAQELHADYGAFGVILIVCFYLARNNRVQQCFYGALCLIWESASIFAYPLIYCYNGKRRLKRGKYFWYAFYPLHLILLYLLHLFLDGIYF
ncbi:MAG: TraX family protein [Lachnospiraceae bacterium]